MKSSILIMLFFIHSIAYAQLGDSLITITPGGESETSYTTDPANLFTTKEYKKESISVKRFDRKKWEEITRDADYNGDRAKRKSNPENQDTVRSESNNSNRRYLDKNEDDAEVSDTHSIALGPWAGLLLQFIFYGGIITLVGLILFYIVKNTSTKSNPKVQKDENIDFTASVKDISELDIDTMIQQAQVAGNYKLAIRIYFLGLLKKLDEIGLISWKRDKTNREYLTELFSKQRYFIEVKKLTLAYEQVWYGDHILPNDLYVQLIEEFKTLDQKLIASKIQ